MEVIAAGAGRWRASASLQVASELPALVLRPALHRAGGPDLMGLWLMRAEQQPNAEEAMMRNKALEELDGLVGRWTLTMSDAWFLEPADTEVHGSATIEWLGDALLIVRSELDGELTLAIGRSDAQDAYSVLYHDDRGVCRVFAMTFDGRRWTLSREDPDFHQRFIAQVEQDRITGRWEASDDEGRTWRKDFDLVFDRA